MTARTRTLVLLLGLCATLRVVSFVRPCLSDDEAIYAVVAREMLAGHALYDGVVDHKPPAIYLVNAATQALGGPIGGMLLLHALLVLVVWGTAVLLGEIVRRFDPRGSPASARAPVAAALLYIVFTTTLVDADSLAANCELFMMLPLCAATHQFLVARETGRAHEFIFAGAYVGAAMLFKYQAGIQLPVFALALVLWDRPPVKRIARAFVGFVAGLAQPFLAVSAWLAASGALASAWFWFKFNFAYIDTGATDAQLGAKIARVGFVIVAAAPLYALAIAALAGDRARTPFVRFTLGWLVASIAAVMVGGRFFGHYFHQLTAPLAVLAAPAAAALWARRPRTFGALLAVPAALFLVLGACHDRLMRAAGEPDPDYHDTIAWLAANAAPDDAICIWGNSPVLYFEAERPLGCRFVFSNYLSGMSPATPGQRDPAIDTSKNIVPQAWDMFVADLETRRPAFVLDGSFGDVAYYGKYPPARFPRLAHVLACAYASVATVDGMRIYHRLAADRCARIQK